MQVWALEGSLTSIISVLENSLVFLGLSCRQVTLLWGHMVNAVLLPASIKAHLYYESTLMRVRVNSYNVNKLSCSSLTKYMVEVLYSHSRNVNGP